VPPSLTPSPFLVLHYPFNNVLPLQFVFLDEWLLSTTELQFRARGASSLLGTLPYMTTLPPGYFSTEYFIDLTYLPKIDPQRFVLEQLGMALLLERNLSCIQV
jgi:hypothetical protein